MTCDNCKSDCAKCDKSIWHKPLSLQTGYDYRAEEERRKERLHDTMQEYRDGVEAFKKKYYWGNQEVSE